MLSGVNKQYNAELADARNNKFIIESVLGVDEVLPGSDEELNDVIDTDSIPADVYKAIDKKMDELIGDNGIDDQEIEELIDEDDDLDDEQFSELDALISEAANAWFDDEGIGHPDVSRRSGVKNQPKFTGTSMVH